MSLSDDIARLHATYTRITGVKEKLTWCVELWKPLVIEYGYDIDALDADLTHACRYMRRRIQEGKRNDEALTARLFLNLQRFVETVALAQACAPSLARSDAAKPVPAAPPVDEAEQERLRQDGKNRLASLMETLKNGGPEDEAEKWLRAYDPIRLNRRTDETPNDPKPSDT